MDIDVPQIASLVETGDEGPIERIFLAAPGSLSVSLRTGAPAGVFHSLSEKGIALNTNISFVAKSKWSIYRPPRKSMYAGKTSRPGMAGYVGYRSSSREPEGMA